MSSGKIVNYIVAVILILIGLGLAVILGFSFIIQAGHGGSVVVGVLFLIIGLVLIAGGGFMIYQAARTKPGEITQNVTYKVDLPANVNVESLKCRSCGGTLTMDNITMVAGAPVVNCPYCHSTYQLTEEPKW